MSGPDWRVIELGQKDFLEEITSANYPVFVDFWANWCPPCRMMEPLIEDLAEEYKGKILFRKLNTDLSPAISQRYNISGIPCLIVFKEGKEIWRQIGALAKKRLRTELNHILE